MRLFVQAARRRPTAVGAEEALILLKDDWNDFSFKTIATLYLSRGDAMEEIGAVRVLKDGQRIGPSPLPDGEVENGRLPPDYGSSGVTLDYYDRLAALGERIACDVLARMNDVAFDASSLARLAGQEGYAKSLNRDRSKPESFYGQAREVIGLGGLPPDAAGFSFSYRSDPSSPPVSFDFKPPAAARRSGLESGPSSRILVLIGANGVGKTQLLARLARLAYAPPSERGEVARDGILDGPAFPSVVAVSYSAFDEFEPPRLAGDDLREIARLLRSHSGRYVYCGMRDLAGKFEDPSGPARLVTQDALAAVFADALVRVRELGRFGLLCGALRPVFGETSLRRSIGTAPVAPEAWEGFVNERLEEPRGFFRALSSGHKIVLLMLTQVSAGLGRRGLALIDEPETHLHPPLLAAAMTGLRVVLESLTAYAVVATHSPVVAQETAARQVLVMEADGGPARFRPPQIETFGENVGTLTREVFGLHTDATDFRPVLDRMFDALGSVEAVERLLGGELPGPALAHVMARAAGRG